MQGKHMVLVLNKIDLVPPTVAAAWKNYFETNFPR
jgi:ribosome biogenesis GTPase A